MAEYKTYTCDFPGCGEQNAIHLTIPAVDYVMCDNDIEREDIPGFVDLCPKHVPSIIPAVLEIFNPNQELRRKLWKTLLWKT